MMNVLWIINTIFPYPAEKLNMKKNSFGGWLNGLANCLKNEKNIKLAIATVYDGKEIKIFDDGVIIYYLIPGAPALKYNKKIEEYWKTINDDFKPDLVHIHGTEYTHGLAFINANLQKKVVVSIQGLIYRYADVYLGNISNKDIIKNITLRDFIKRDNLFQQKKNFIIRGKNEIEIIKNSNSIIGRTTWDYANVKAINPMIKYYNGNETLREKFYENLWDIKNIDKYTIFCSQAGYPIKGAHYLIKTIAILKERYSNIKLYIGGTNIINSSNLKDKIRMNGYGKYLKNLIKKYELEKNIVFTGVLNEEEIIKKLLRTHIFVLPSAIENSSNSLGEAMLLGMPCVASNTGGTMDILKHKEEGYLYPYTEPAMCAEYISKLFEDDNLAIKFGEYARQTALKRHNQQNNVKDILNIYNNVLGEE